MLLTRDKHITSHFYLAYLTLFSVISKGFIDITQQLDDSSIFG